MSESASPQRWGEEHEIDLGALGEAGPAPGPDPEPRRAPRIPNAALAYAAILIALAAAVIAAVKWSPLHRPLAEATVQSFLEAVLERDVDEALSYTDAADEEGPFLVPEALDTNWAIVTVAQVAYDASTDDAGVSQVYAEIEAADGTRLGHRYRVEVGDGEARIVNAMVKSEAWGAIGHLDLNGVRYEIDPQVGVARVMLLPGVYEFYPDLPSTLRVAGENSMLVLGDRYLTPGADDIDDWLPAPWIEVTPEGEDAVNTALRAHFDACAADPAREHCPFAFPEDPERELALAPGATWEVTVYPTVMPDRMWYEHQLGFRLQSSMPGEARAQVVITEDGATRTARVSCPIWVDGLYADLDAEGGASIVSGYGLAEDRCRTLVEVD